MEKIYHKNKYWKTCSHCNSTGRVVRGPSKKRLRAYRIKLKTFMENNSIGLAPEYPHSNKDICLECQGSGLSAAIQNTLVDNNFPNIAIIGGGIGGAALAVACLHRGIPFTLYERDRCFNERSQGYGLTLQQASKAIAGLGICLDSSGIISTRHVVHDSNGKIIGEWGMRRWVKKQDQLIHNTKRKNIHISRQFLRYSLIEQLENSNSVKWGYKFLGFSKTNNDDIQLKFDVGGDIESRSADLIVGADGIRSSLRNNILGTQKKPLQYLGCIVILGICSLDAIDDIDSPLLDSETVFQTVNGKERLYVMPYDKKNIMWQLSFPLSEKDALKLHKKGAQSLKKETLSRLFNWHKPIPQIISNTPDSLITGYPVYDRQPFDVKDLQEFKNITLIGDAAHPMSPFKGQGANQALLDALSLARIINTSCNTNSHWRKTGLRKTVLNKFEKEMSKRTTSKVKSSALAVKLLHSNAVLHDGDTPRGRGVHSSL